MDAELQESPPPSALQWRGDVGILICFIGGLLLALNAPFWLKPPHLALTGWIYVALFLAWIPLYIIRRRNHPRVSLTMLVVILGTMVNCCLCTLFIPRTGGNAAFGLGWLDSVDCQSVPMEGNRVRYECIRHAFDGPEFDQHMTLEGYDWLPIVWKVLD